MGCRIGSCVSGKRESEHERRSDGAKHWRQRGSHMEEGKEREFRVETEARADDWEKKRARHGGTKTCKDL